MRRYIILFLVFAGSGCATGPAALHQDQCSIVDIGPFPRLDAAKHQVWIQASFDRRGVVPAVFRFAPGDYVINDAKGLRVPSSATLFLDGARFFLPKDIQTDGQTFLLDSVVNVCIHGGEILGARSAWSAAVNVAGIRVLGQSRDIRIQGLTCRDLSSNAVGVFGTSDAPIRDISMVDVSAVNCCNEYADYLEPNKGPAAGSDRRDQGAVAFYYVDGWSVETCEFKGSHSDGTHFFQCRNGRFSNCTVEGSKMGGYFLEGCVNVLACGNLIRGNGSRGVTIERDSRFCTLMGNLVEHSGREGLWMPDACSIIVSGNVFTENGRKDDGDKDCEIRLDDADEYATQTRDVRIEGNIFKTSPHQTATIYQGPGVTHVEINNNTFEGAAPRHN